MSHNGRTNRGGNMSTQGNVLMARVVLEGRWARRRAQYESIVGKKTPVESKLDQEKRRAFIRTL